MKVTERQLIESYVKLADIGYEVELEKKLPFSSKRLDAIAWLSPGHNSGCIVIEAKIRADSKTVGQIIGYRTELEALGIENPVTKYVCVCNQYDKDAIKLFEDNNIEIFQIQYSSGECADT